MEVENISEVVSGLMLTPDLGKLIPLKENGFWKNQLKAALNLIPKVGGALAQELQNYEDYKLSEFFRKFTAFILELTDVSVDERVKFSEEVQKKAEDMSGNVILGMVDRLDNINKQKILANLTKARIHGFISIEDFFRLSSMLERIPYVDLKLLAHYKEPYYDDSGDTELLYATGALEIHTIDYSGSNKYILSLLGEKILRFGCCINLDMKREKGTNLELPTMTEDDVHEIVNGAIKKATPSIEGGALKWEEL